MDEQTTPPGYYGTRDVARALQTSPGAIRNLVYRGRLKRAGGTERRPWYRAEDVAALLAERRTRAAA
ncbi:helix-turn-helix domain-containing protein [Streptomyces parvulus]|uniref:helix-turn-helix domain-containing protein n=1 Tax=Streptomyces parvulus TaxID=146923 RepID=UPI00332ACAB9